MELVSIITPCYNSAKTIGLTIDSVISQTYVDWELIIVDDCSVDNSLDVINSKLRDDLKITVIPLKNNVGAAEARNIALRKAKGRYIAFLDSDDIWISTKLRTQILFMSSNRYAFSFTSYQVISEDGKKYLKVINAPKQIDYYQYLKNTIIGCLTVIVDRDTIGYFEMPNIRSSHDMALWLNLLKRGYKAYGLNEVLGYYRSVDNSNSAKKGKAALDVWRVYRKIEGLSFFYSLYCFFCYAYNAMKKRVI